MPLTLSPEQLATFKPDAPAPITLTPEQLASFQPDAQQPAPTFDVMRDFSAEQLVSLASQDKNFNLIDTYDSVPEKQKTPEMLAKVQEAYHQIRQQPWYLSTPVVSGLVEGDLGKTMEGVKQVGGNIAGMAAGAGKWIGNVAGVAAGNVAGAAARVLGVDEAARAQNELETQRRAAEAIAGTEAGVAGLVHQAGQIGGTLSRATGLAKPLANYTPEEKQADFLAALSRHKIQKETMTGHGPILSNLPSAAANVANLEAAGMPVRPEEVSAMASGDPLTFMLFGKGMGAATGAAKFVGADIAARTGADALISQLPTAAGAEGLAQAVGGRIIQGLGKGAELGTAGVEKTAPLIGAAAGSTVAAHIPVIGEAPLGLGHIAGALEGWRAGKAAATSLHKLGQNLKGITEAGKNIATDQITGAYEQLAKDIFRSVPGAVGSVAHGAAFDLALATTMDTPEERQGLGVGAAFGLAGAGARTFRNTVSGQIISPRSMAGNQVARPANAGASPALVKMHAAAFPTLTPGQKVRVNSIQKFAAGINPNADFFVAPDAATAKAGLVASGVPEATAEDWSQQSGMTFEQNGRKVVVLIGDRGIDAAPHEAHHAIENVIGEEALRQIDQDVIASNDINAIGRDYASRMGVEMAPGENWHDAILDRTGAGNRDAVEKMIQDATTQYNDEARRAGNEPPTADEIRQLVENQAAQNGVKWRNVLTPEEQVNTAERYIAREIEAEHFDALFKHTGGDLAAKTQIPEKMAKVIAEVMATFGVNPLAGRVSEGLKVPLSRDILGLTKEAVQKAQPIVIPAAEPTAARAGIPRTPAEVEQAAADAAEIAKTAPDVALPGASKTQREILGITSEAIANRSGLKLNYLSAPDEPAAAISSNRGVRREMIEIYRRMPEHARKLWEKTFFPESVSLLQKGGYQFIGWTPEILAANAQKLAETFLQHPDLAKLSPYELDPTSKSFSRNGWLDFYGDVQTFVKNQQAGYTGAGGKLVVPSEMQAQGFFKPSQKPGASMALDQGKADVINALFGFKLPTTNKLGHGKFPLNLAGQEIIKSTMGDASRISQPLVTRAPFGGPAAEKLGIAGRQILEVNPFRNRLEKATAAVGVKMPSFIEAVQRLNLDRILEADHAPEVPQFRGNSLTLSAGLLPGDAAKENVTDAALKFPDGKIYYGRTHALAIDNAVKSGRGITESYDDADFGFRTTQQPFVNRFVARRIAEAADQTFQSAPSEKNPQLLSEQIVKPGTLKELNDERRASFMPAEGKREISIEGPDGKKYRAMFDGFQDFTSIGKGKFSQITPLEDIPGVVTARSTTYGPTLEKAGFKLPALEEPAASKTVSVYSGSDGAISSWFTTNPDRARTYGGQTMKLDLPRDVFNRLQAQSEAAGRPKSDIVVPHEWVKKAVETDLGGEKPPVEIATPAEEETFWSGNKSEENAQFMAPEDEPKKTLTAYKLFGTKKSQPGKIFPLFIGKNKETSVGIWIEAEHIPTKGFAERPGWHVGKLPIANHLLNKQGKPAEGRVWAEVEIPADVDWQSKIHPTKGLQNEVPKGGFYRFKRPERQGTEWMTAGALKVNKILSPAEVSGIVEKATGTPDVQFMHSLEGIKKMNDEEIARQRRAGETETSRLSSHTGDEESGVVLHSAKNRSTIFVPPGEQSAKLLDELDAATTDRQRNRIIEQHYANAQFSPAPTAGVENAVELKDARKQWREKGTDSPYFKKWFGKSQVVDSFGDPQVVYHGTTHKFDVFNREKANVENYAGAGFYFSTESADARKNYAGLGPDLKGRVGTLQERLEGEVPRTVKTELGFEIDRPVKDIRKEARKLAEQQLVGPTKRVIEAYVKLENPVHLGDKERKTYFELEIDEAGKESGTGLELYESILRQSEELGVDGQKVWEEVSQNGPEMVADEVFQNIANANAVLDAYHEDEQGNPAIVGSELFRRVMEDLGFDGIIQHDAGKKFGHMGVSPFTKHIIAFRGDQIKATANKGTFSPADQRIQFMPKGKKEERRLPNALGKGRIAAVHYGNTPELTHLDPEMMGQGSATSADQRGLPKTFFFKQGSEFGGDVGRFTGKQGYATNIDQSRLYDTTKGDPLGYFGENRLKAEQKIKDAGYSGVYVETPDGRKVMAMFEGGTVKDIGRANETGLRALGPVEQLPGLSAAVKVKGKTVYPVDKLMKGKQYFSSPEDALEKKGILSLDDYSDSGYPVEHGYTDKKGNWVSAENAYRALNPEGLKSEHVQYLPGGVPEAIKAAAVRDRETGKVYEGYAHFAARQTAIGEGVAAHKTIGMEDGFVTNGGEFLNREEAFKRAVELKQYKPEKVPSITNSPDRSEQLESVRFKHQQKMKEMGYEPDVQFTPGLPGKFEDKSFEKSLKDIRSGKLFGATFNADGTPWARGENEKPDVVSLASMNVPQGKLTQAAIDKFLAPFEDLLDEPNVKLGTYNFSTGGVPTTSIDLNAIVDQKHRANTVKFAKENDQESIWDAVKEETVQTGGKGNTRLKSLSEINEALKPLTKGKPVDVAGIIADNAPAAPRPTQGNLFGEEETTAAYDRSAEANTTKSELAARHPESVIPARRDELIPSAITKSPVYKAAGSEEAAVKSFSKLLTDFVKEYKDHPVFKDGLKWYSEIVPKLKKQFGKHADIMAELLAATSPQNNPEQNYQSAMEAIEMSKAGKFDRQVKKYVEGLAKLETDEWQASGAKTKAAFMDAWIKEHDLLPRKSNGAKFGISSGAVLKVLARNWLQTVEGPKTYQFVRNLLGTDHGATIDVWADRTMRRLGYSGHVDRWRILPKNATGVIDTDFHFSQKAFAHAAAKLGILPDALQGGLWFAEKQLWADRGYGKLDLGSFAKEMEKTEQIRKGIHQRLSAPVQQELLVQPRIEK